MRGGQKEGKGWEGESTRRVAGRKHLRSRHAIRFGANEVETAGMFFWSMISLTNLSLSSMAASSSSTLKKTEWDEMGGLEWGGA